MEIHDKLKVHVYMCLLEPYSISQNCHSRHRLRNTKTVVCTSNDNAVNAISISWSTCSTIPFYSSCNCSCINALWGHKLNKCNFNNIFFFSSHDFMPAKLKSLYLSCCIHHSESKYTSKCSLGLWLNVLISVIQKSH